MTNSQQVIQELAARYGSFDPTRQQLLRKQYWDYVRYNPAGTTNMQLFSVPLGGTDPISGLSKTLEQTNLTRTGQFENVTYLIYEIRTHIFILPKNRQPSAIVGNTRLVNATWAPVTLALNDLANQGVLNLNIGQKQYFDLDQPFRRAPAGFGVQINSITSAAAAGPTQPPLNYWLQQSPRKHDVYSLTPPQLIENQQTFQLSINFPRGASPAIPTVSGANTAIDIGVVFDGYVIQPVQ